MITYVPRSIDGRYLSVLGDNGINMRRIDLTNIIERSHKFTTSEVAQEFISQLYNPYNLEFEIEKCEMT